MSSDPETTRIVRSWLDEGVTVLPDRVLDAVLDELPATPQRRPVWSAWRTPIMNKIIATGLGAAAMFVALFVGAQLFGAPSGGFGGPGPDTASPTLEPTADPTAEPTAEPTSTPAAGLPEGPFALEWPEQPSDAPRIIVTIPAPGWEEISAGTLLRGEERDNLPEAAVLSWSQRPGAEFYVYGDPCRWESTTPDSAATTVDEFVSALAAQVGRNPSEPRDVTVDGYAGMVITVHTPDDADPGACEGGEFTMFGTQADDFARYNQGPGQIDELWVIDVEGSIVIFDLMYRPDSRNEIVGELRSLAEQATFEVP